MNWVADALSRAPYQPEPEETMLPEDDEMDGIGANAFLDKDVQKRIYEAAGLDFNLARRSPETTLTDAQAQTGAAAVDMVVTRSVARNLQEQREIEIGMADDDEEDDEVEEPPAGEEPIPLPDMDPCQVPLMPLLLPSLWAQEPYEGRDPVERDLEGHWIAPAKQKPNGFVPLWVPPNYRRDVLRAFHWCPTSAHPSDKKMHEAVRLHVWWSGCKKDITEYVKKCSVCQLKRLGGQDKPPLQTRRNAQCPMQRISLDILSLNKIGAHRTPYVLVIMDEFSRYAEAFPIANQTAQKVSEVFFREFVTRYGVPEEIVTDQGGCFMSELFTDLCAQLQIRKLHTAAYRPQGNGGNERMHSTLYGILRMITSVSGRDWKKKLPLALYVYRNTVHKALGMTPHQALFGYANRQVTMEFYRPDEETSIDQRIQQLQELHHWIQTRMSDIQGARNDNVNEHRRLRTYEPGDLVKFKRHVRNKLEPLWDGPAEVIRRIGPVDYELRFLSDNIRKHPVVHAAYLRPYFTPEETPEFE